MSDPHGPTQSCAACGALIQPRDRFCPDCGRALTVDRSPAVGGQPVTGPLWDQARDDVVTHDERVDDYRRPDPLRNDSRNGVLFVAAALILVVGILIGSVLWFLSRAASVEAGTGTSTSSAPTASGSESSSAAPGDSASATPDEAGTGLPAVTGQQSNCEQSGDTAGPWTHSVSGNPGTSCEFAEALRAAFLAQGPAPTTLTVTSPVTNQAYPMACDVQPTVVTCRGTQNASIEVLLYP
ncbi:MAG: zinc ribbon domain-containing protein [Phycicoccus sp.]|nr:zinc ribbon domain-containing protein [Phycicoccus sp.]